MIIRPQNINMGLYRDEVVSRGLFPGFVGLYKYFSFYYGYPLFIAGDPYSGKTEFSLELLVTAAELYGKKSALYLGETGNTKDIKAELMSKFIKKPYKKFTSKGYANEHAMTASEERQAEMWVDEHFAIFDPEKDYTLTDFYKQVNDFQNETGVKFHQTLFDPVVDAKGWQQTADFLLPELKMVRGESAKSGRIDILVNHVGDTDKIKSKGTRRMKLPAMPDEWAGGKSWFRRAFPMLLVFRPDPDSVEDGVPVQENEAWIIIQKAKPKGMGLTGKCSLFWDWQKNRYYEQDKLGMKKYARPEPKVDEFQELKQEKQPAFEPAQNWEDAPF